MVNLFSLVLCLWVRIEPTRVEHLRLLASPANIRLGWKGLPRTNAIAYYEKVEITGVKSFITLAQGVNIIKLITAVIYKFVNKLEHLSMANLFKLILCLWVRPGDYPRVEHLKDASPG